MSGAQYERSIAQPGTERVSRALHPQFGPGRTHRYAFGYSRTHRTTQRQVQYKTRHFQERPARPGHGMPPLLHRIIT